MLHHDRRLKTNRTAANVFSFIGFFRVVLCSDTVRLEASRLDTVVLALFKSTLLRDKYAERDS